MRKKQAVKRNPTWSDSDPNPHLWFSEFPNSTRSLQDGLLCKETYINDVQSFGVIFDPSKIRHHLWMFPNCVKVRSCSDASYYITIVFRNTYRYSDGVMEYSSKKAGIIFF
jgi:hypothetical protein